MTEEQLYYNYQESYDLAKNDYETIFNLAKFLKKKGGK